MPTSICDANDIRTADLESLKRLRDQIGRYGRQLSSIQQQKLNEINEQIKMRNDGFMPKTEGHSDHHPI